jgi:hypothetical protein
MVDKNLLTIFIAVTAVAVLIQTGILAGFFFLSTKLSRQADQAMDVTRTMLDGISHGLNGFKSVQSVAKSFWRSLRSQ